ncbi:MULTISPECIES: DUF305 domain-containing protein [Flavobacterium]|uniref:DUF305 domain-containing protein n=1 Tax=Flavobacterium limi TaxID=2045105 RepID=A0ABQ1UAQ2_9FLAO|nr:DUF305 domain-containing protein [Flavobacterium limi]GGF14648.1 hypothetical protein GCM10011518_25010 [Flavobacterium limi]
MKKTIVLLAMTIVGLCSCSNDDDNKAIQLQSHDSNKMMQKMHTMMTEMDGMTMKDDPDIDFATMMIMHHQGAIDMANLELQEGTNTEMKAKAKTIIDAQQKEIQQLQSILSGLILDNTDANFSTELMMSMKKMGTDADTQLITGDIDNDFATMMIVHHQAALDNASAYIHHGSNVELNTMAKMMVDLQTKEIIELAQWLIENRR